MNDQIFLKASDTYKDIFEFTELGYPLKLDLLKISRSNDINLSEAVVFYAARLLESMSGLSLHKIGLNAKSNSYSNLSVLESYRLITQNTLCCAHSLRRSGNKIRHNYIEIDNIEKEASVAFLIFFMRWYFCEFNWGPKLPVFELRDFSVTSPDEPWIIEFLDEISDVNADLGVVSINIDRQKSDKTSITKVPSLVSILAEKLLSREMLAEANDLLSKALEINSQDLRLQQLKGLYLSRSKKLNEARDVLEPLHRKFPKDPETIGILAGVYKRLWETDASNSKWLKKSNKLYRSGWENEITNTYLGINAATTSLILGDEKASKQIARKVIDELRKRKTFFTTKPNVPFHDLGLWDQLTLAEAEMLIGNKDEAVHIFDGACKSYSDHSGDLNTCRNQLKLIERYGNI